MDGYRLSAYAHIFFGIVFVGLALFWLVMLAAARRLHAPSETESLLQTANRARWPHVVVPYKLRLPLPWMTWAVLMLVALSGIASMQFRGEAPAGDTLWWSKLALFGAIVISQIFLMKKPSALAIRINFALAIVIIAVSAWLVR